MSNHRGIDLGILDRHREAVQRIEDEERELAEREYQASKERGKKAAIQEFMRLQPLFGLPVNRARAERLAEENYRSDDQ